MSQGLSPPLCPSRAFVLGVWANHDASNRRPRVFHHPADQRIYVRSTAPMRFLLHPEDVLAPSSALLRTAPACLSKPEVFKAFALSERTARFPAPYAPSVSPNYQRAVYSGSVLVARFPALLSAGMHGTELRSQKHWVLRLSAPR